MNKESEAMGSEAAVPWDDSVEMRRSQREADYVAFLQWMDAEFERGAGLDLARYIKADLICRKKRNEIHSTRS
jgi:hypothetical protein